MKINKRILFSAIVAAAASILYIKYKPHDGRNMGPESRNSAPASDGGQGSSPAFVADDQRVKNNKPEPVAVPPGPEVAATRRMYAAHAPLRTPQVADPDSVPNRQILQTMVMKAMADARKESESTTR